MRILVRATNWVGDAVMSIPALEAIRARWAEAEITVTGPQAIIELYRGQAFADRLARLGGNGAQKAGNERFDLGIVLPNSFASAWQVWRAGARERAGYARDARRWLLTRPVSRPRPGEIPPHECYYYLELLRRAGWIAELPRIERIRLGVEPEAAARASARLEALGAHAPRVALAAGASYGAAKCWLPERYAEAGDRLCDEFGASIVLLGTAAECEIGRRIAAAMRHPPVDLTGRTSTAELPALAAACHLFVGNDSGAMHVAAAVGLPVIAVFGSTDPGGTAPPTPDRTIVRHRVSCSPCFLRYCPVDHRCMTGISAEEVFRAAANGMQGKPAR